MAGKLDKDLYDELRTRGLRKRTARAASSAVLKMNGTGQVPKALRATVEDLRSAVEQLEGRVQRSDRATAARKAARTRKRDAAKRSAAARKAARSRSPRGGRSRSTGSAAVRGSRGRARASA